MEQFCVSYNLKSLIKEPTCFKSVGNPSCIDLILTNHPKCFQNSGIKEGSLNLLFSYFKNRKQRVRLNNTYSEWKDILFGVPQGSILGPLLFNIFLCDLFLFLHDIPVANYADDNTPYCTGFSDIRMF